MRLPKKDFDAWSYLCVFEGPVRDMKASWIQQLYPYLKQNIYTARYFRFQPRWKSEFRSCGTSRSVDWYFVADFLGQPIGSKTAICAA